MAKLSPEAYLSRAIDSVTQLRGSLLSVQELGPDDKESKKAVRRLDKETTKAQDSVLKFLNSRSS